MKIRIVKKIMNNAIKHNHLYYSKYYPKYYYNSVRKDFLNECIAQKKHILNNPNKEIKSFMRFIKAYKDSVLLKPIYYKHPYYIKYLIDDMFNICMFDDI